MVFRAALLAVAISAASVSLAGTPVAAGYDPATITPEMLATTETIAKALEGVAPEGWKPTGIVERYTPVNMYGKINGRSELFMSYGVIGMTWVSVVSEADPDLTIEAYLYDQGSTLSAFGVYSVERWQEAEAVKMGTEGYRSGADLFFRKGHYYVTLLGSDDLPEMRAAQEAMAKTIAGRLADDPQPLWGDEALPKKGRVAQSIKYFKTDAMSLDFLKNTFVCEIESDGAKLTHFISRLEDEATAKAALAAYQKYLSSYGGKAETLVDEKGGAIVVGDAGGGFFDAIFQRETDVAGVTAVPSKDAAIGAAKALRTHLKQ